MKIKNKYLVDDRIRVLVRQSRFLSDKSRVKVTTELI